MPLKSWLAPAVVLPEGDKPYHHGNDEIIKKRREAIYAEDRNKKVRKSHENKEILELYKNYLGEPFGERAHELFHTHFEERERI